MSGYSTRIHEQHEEDTRRSAERIVPVVLEIIRPRSVIDVGCGTGIWLSVFREAGVRDTMGIDSDHIDRRRLRIPQDQFVPFDLRRSLPVRRTFDLVVCLEVAEHLPRASAELLIRSLT